MEPIMNKCPVMTIAVGTPVADNQNSQTARPRGPVLMLPRFIQIRQIGHFCRANPDYGGCAAKGLGISIDEIIGKAA
jgi:catalase